MVKGRKNDSTKASSPYKQNQMLCCLNRCQDIIVRGYIELKSPLLPFEVLNMGNNDLSTNPKYDNRSNINFPFHHALSQVDLNTNLIDKVI